MFCGARHMPNCSCRLCRTVKRGYVIPTKSRAKADKTPLTLLDEDQSMKKPNVDLKGEPLDELWDDEGFKIVYPNLYEHLKETKYDDGTPRQTSTLLIFSDNGCLKLCLSDRDNNRSVFVSAVDFDTAMVKIERGLAEDNLPWKGKPKFGNQSKTPPY